MGSRRFDRRFPVVAPDGKCNNKQGTSNYTNHAQANPIVTENDLEGLNNAERTILMTAAPGIRATGTLHILQTDNPDEKKLVIAIRGLKASSDHVYQVWKHSGDRVEAVGTVEPTEDGTAMFASRLSIAAPSRESPSPRKNALKNNRLPGRDLLVAGLSHLGKECVPQRPQNGEKAKRIRQPSREARRRTRPAFPV